MDAISGTSTLNLLSSSSGSSSDIPAYCFGPILHKERGERSVGDGVVGSEQQLRAMSTSLRAYIDVAGPPATVSALRLQQLSENDVGGGPNDYGSVRLPTSPIRDEWRRHQGHASRELLLDWSTRRRCDAQEKTPHRQTCLVGTAEYQEKRHFCRKSSGRPFLLGQ